jgi:hypothetical protein
VQNDCGNIWLTVNPADIDLLNKIIEGYEHLGVLSTIDRHNGLVVVRGTADTRRDLMHILTNLPFEISIKNGPAV